MKVVKVYGALKEQLGQGRFEFVADTPAQALKALLVNFPKLEKWLLDSEKRGVAYQVTVGTQAVHDKDVTGLYLPWSEKEVFSITPVLMGAGGFTQVLTGLGFIAAAILLGPIGYTAIGLSAPLFAAGTGIATAFGLVGASLVLNGVAEMISPVPQPITASEEPTLLESSSFSGIVNTTKKGVAVPIAYGRVFVGSAVVSAGLDVDQV